MATPFLQERNNASYFSPLQYASEENNV